MLSRLPGLLERNKIIKQTDRYSTEQNVLVDEKGIQIQKSNIEYGRAIDSYEVYFPWTLVRESSSRKISINPDVFEITIYITCDVEAKTWGVQQGAESVMVYFASISIVGTVDTFEAVSEINRLAASSH